MEILCGNTARLPRYCSTTPALTIVWPMRSGTAATRYRFPSATSCGHRRRLSATPTETPISDKGTRDPYPHPRDGRRPRGRRRAPHRTLGRVRTPGLRPHVPFPPQDARWKQPQADRRGCTCERIPRPRRIPGNRTPAIEYSSRVRLPQWELRYSLRRLAVRDRPVRGFEKPGRHHGSSDRRTTEIGAAVDSVRDTTQIDAHTSTAAAPNGAVEAAPPGPGGAAARAGIPAKDLRSTGPDLLLASVRHRHTPSVPDTRGAQWQRVGVS